MWAQGLTVGVLIAAGILTHKQRQEAAGHKVRPHSKPVCGYPVFIGHRAERGPFVGQHG